MCEEASLPIQFEFIAPNTPQQNGKIERKFQTLYGKISSMLNWARLTERLRHRLWAQCADVATKLENIIVKGGSEMSAHEKFYGYALEIFEYLRTFGEVAMVHDENKINGKLTNRGIPCLFIGYAEDHSPDVYQFLNQETEPVESCAEMHY